MMHIAVAGEVADALAAGRAVVALESTIISHGMPYPANVDTARQLEAVIREHGAVPATIAVLDGRCHAGLTDSQLERVATDSAVHKATTRDLPWLIAHRGNGATTVAATMRIAALAGIDVFATGGIGGVHRGATATFDISADLAELGRVRVAVVSAGVKSVLDIGLTLEYLETLGVPVLVNGSDEFPSFYSRSSGHPAPRRVDGPDDIAAVLHSAWTVLGLSCGVSIANPIPLADEIPASEISEVIEQALADLERRGITGQAVSPFLLSRVAEATEGRSLAANIALVRNNAALAAQVAVAFNGLKS